MTQSTHAPRWRGRDRWVQLSTGFDATQFLRLWADWRADPGPGALRHAIVIDAAPPDRVTIGTLACAPELKPLRDALARVWPPLTPDLHTLVLDAGAVTLALAVGEVEPWLAQLEAEVDAFDIATPTVRGPRFFRALARLAVPQAQVALAGPTDDDRRALRSAGFEATALSRGAGRSGGEALEAVYAPRFLPRTRWSTRSATITERHALIVGGGLAGCATACALAERGWRSTVVDTHPQPAGAASGNPAGLFHGVVHPQDGAHARLHRIAALQARQEVEIAVRDHGVAGSTAGLLRHEARLDVSAMRALIDALQLPPDYVRAVDAAEATVLCGLPRSGPAWFYPGAGWVDPAGLARSYLARAGDACLWRGGHTVAHIARREGRWRLLDADGQTIAQSPTLVLANADGAARLAGVDWPLHSVRGQLSWLEPDGAGASRCAIEPPRIAITGPGYLLPWVDGRMIFGATAQPGDPDPSVRRSDHAANLASLARLIGHDCGVDPDRLAGRTAWRCSAPDRFPVIGALSAGNPQADGGVDRDPRDRADQDTGSDGLHVHIGLGSRGIGWSALGSRLLAAAIAGGPSPLPAGLRAAIDPARFAARAARRARATAGIGRAQNGRD
ncbi:MAG: FAD-dependent 5-carboxymethylaminomethyl-2-thiouridine(34) oxidoreductase MnmC [Burkholderiaceae bacterium]